MAVLIVHKIEIIYPFVSTQPIQYCQHKQKLRNKVWPNIRNSIRAIDLYWNQDIEPYDSGLTWSNFRDI